MSKFVIEPHFRLQEWVAEELGFFSDAGLDYDFEETIRSTGGKATTSSLSPPCPMMKLNRSSRRGGRHRNPIFGSYPSRSKGPLMLRLGGQIRFSCPRLGNDRQPELSGFWLPVIGAIASQCHGDRPGYNALVTK